MSNGFISLRCEPRTGYMKAANEPSTSTRDWEFRDWLKTYRFLKRNTAPHAACHLPYSLHSTFLPNDQFNSYPAARTSALITRRCHHRSEINVKSVRRNIPKSGRYLKHELLSAQAILCQSERRTCLNWIRQIPVATRRKYHQLSCSELSTFTTQCRHVLIDAKSIHDYFPKQH